MKQRVWLAVIGMVCAAGLLLGLGMLRFGTTAPNISFDPPSLEIKEAQFQGQPLVVQFDLRNESAAPVTVESFSKSCGCMVLSGKDGIAPKTPFVLEPKASVPLTLNLSTGGQFGPQVYNTSVVARGSDGAPATASATVRVNVLAALHAEPGMVIFRRAKPGIELSAEFKVADGIADPGVAIREVSVSNDKTMRIEMQPESGPSDMFGNGANGRARATLKLSYTPDATERRVHEWISVVPVEERYPALRIPVYCEIADRPFRFMPERLTIPRSAETTFRRTVAFVCDEPQSTISVVRSPQDMKIEIGQPTGLRRMITISGETSALSERPSEIVFLANGQEVAFSIGMIAVD